MKQKRIWDISYYISENNHNRQYKNALPAVQQTER